MFCLTDITFVSCSKLRVWLIFFIYRFALILFFFVCWLGLADLSGVEESLRGYDTQHDEGGGGACVVF